MMNIQGAKAADTASSSKLSSAGKKGVDNGDGFSDALSGVDQGNGNQKARVKPVDNARAGGASANSNANANAEKSDVAGQEVVTEDPTAAKPKPIIDIRPESLRKPVAAKVDLSILKQQAEGAKPSGLKETAVKETVVKETGTRETVAKDQPRALTAAEKRLKEALVAAKVLTERAEALERMNVGAEAADLDVDALLSADDRSVKLEEVLSLLNAQGAAAALESMAPVPKHQGAQARRSQDEMPAPRGKADVASALSSLSTVSAKAEIQAGNAAATPSPPDEDRLFRFQSAKDDRQSMDMVVGADTGRERSAELRNPGAAETVTVLDSRRFLGLAPNASALTAALSGDSDWVAAMQSTGAAQDIAAQNPTGNVVNTLKLQMNPHDLGSVTAMLRLQGEQLHVHLTVETRAAYRQLSDDSNGIVDALRSQGFAVDQVTISIAPAGNSDAAENQQQNGQQPPSQGDRQGGAADRGQENASRRQASQQFAGQGHEGKSESGPAAGSDGTRSGQLYL